MFEQQDAIVRLLEDDDQDTVTLVKQQLAESGPEALPDLRELLANARDETIARHLLDVIGEIDSRTAMEELTQVCPTLEENADLEPINWLLARALLPGVDVSTYSARLNQWARELDDLHAVQRTGAERVQALGYFLGVRLGFRGNSRNYYAAENSLLPRVIDTRHGIPISLTLLYILIGQRCGVVVEGINFPGHFLARHDGVLFDPFERGRIIGLSECRQILARQKLEFQPEHLAPADSVMMFRRILANLLYVYQSDGDTEQAALITMWIHALERKTA